MAIRRNENGSCRVEAWLQALRQRGSGPGHQPGHPGQRVPGAGWPLWGLEEHLPEVDPLLWNSETFVLTHQLLISNRADISERRVTSNPTVAPPVRTKRC